MRIKRAKRSEERKAKIAPAEWQQFIEIQLEKNKSAQNGLIFLLVYLVLAFMILLTREPNSSILSL